MTMNGNTIFASGSGPKVIGMVHLPPLPGTPYHSEGTFPQAREAAVRDALALDKGGAHGCLIQTVDRVYTRETDCDPARIAAMTLIAAAVVEATRPGFLVGIQVMKNSIEASLGIAKAVGAHFVRATAFVGATSSAQGLVRGDPYRVIAYRKSIAAEAISIVADIRTQHFQWAEGTPSLARIARWARDAGADAVCLGDPDETTTLDMIRDVRAASPELPVLLPGYTNHDNAARLLAAAEGAFVGTCLQDGGWSGPIDEKRVRAYVDAVGKGEQ